MRLWRIARASYAALDGEGSRLYGSRWTPPGYAVVYASATLSLAALERFVHADEDVEPDDLISIEVIVAEDLAIESVELGVLPDGWHEYPAPPSLSVIGTQWLRTARTAILSIPSAVIPTERNYLINPLHADFARLTIGRPAPFRFDSRLRRH